AFIIMILFLLTMHGGFSYGQQTTPPTTVVAPQLNESDLTKVTHMIVTSDDFRTTTEGLVKKIAFKEILTFTFLLGCLFSFVSTILLCRKWYRTKMKEELEKAFYQTDARKIRLWVPDKNFDAEATVIKKWGFDNTKTYSYLAKAQQSGCVVVMCTSEDEHEQMEKFVDELKQGDSKVGVVAYTAGRTQRIAHEKLLQYPYFQIANGPSTIPSAVWNLARGLC
ncbi:MAG: hypothetical protein V1855_00400, partial [bacterium]